MLANINPEAEEAIAMLREAAIVGHVETVQALIAAGADILAKDASGATPLHYAAKFGHTETVQALIAAGADIDAKDNNGETPLLYATHLLVRTDAIYALIAAGADVNVKGKDGYTLLHKVISGVCAETETEMVRALAAAGADVDAKDNYGYTPLHFAAMHEQADTFRALVELGANLYIRNKEDWETPLELASDMENAEMDKMLAELSRS